MEETRRVFRQELERYKKKTGVMVGRWIDCPDCKGKGKVDIILGEGAKKIEKCETCEGRGLVKVKIERPG
ncbi:unnamed protein product [marine sediment metagenome]|uniref:CR-type domain-containing protein n=1 Tax=marine sediment metagenome TaxID=412755 RepID=X1GNN4_9ZZZZ